MDRFNLTHGEAETLAALIADALAHFDGVGAPIASTRRASDALRAAHDTTAAQSKGRLRSLESKGATVRGPDDADHPGRGPRFYRVTFAPEFADAIVGGYWAQRAADARQAAA